MESKDTRMRVIKRDNSYENISFDKVLNRIHNLCYELNGVSADEIAQKVCARIYDGVKTSELDELAAQLCASFITTHPDYGILASRIIISNHHKNTSPSFSEVITILKNNVDIHGNPSPLVSDELVAIINSHKEKLNSIIDYTRDYGFDYFGFKTLERSYLTKVNGKIIERPQHMWLRVALGIHGNDMKEAIETYDYMSKKYFTHATPTLFNAGTNKANLASCFLLGMGDSVNGMYRKCLADCADISKSAGGIGIHIHDIRAKMSYIRGTNGYSSGIVPLLRVYNQAALHINQGGRRQGSIAVYLEPWHADIENFLELRKNHGNEEERCRDLFTALWIPDIFMKRVQDDGDWCLMCPDECRGLSDSYGDTFDQLYLKYESEGKFRKKVKAQQIWMAAMKSQIETGTPYLLYKDAANKKSNQQNIGTIRSSNLCVAPETMILTENGYFKIKDLEEKEEKIWNGHEFSKVIIKKTGTMQKLITIGFNNGITIRCTPYHKFHIETGKRPFEKSIVKIIDAKDLKINMNIVRYNLPTLNTGTEIMNSPYTHGLFCAEGTYQNINNLKQCNFNKWNETDFCKRHQNYKKIYNSNKCSANSGEPIPLISLYGDKKKLLNFIDYIYILKNDEINNKITIGLNHNIHPKYYVPINGTIDTKLRWLEGYLDGDGCLIFLNGIKNIQFTSINYDFIKDIFYMLQTLGVNTKIKTAHSDNIRFLPDGKGGNKEYLCKKLYRVNIDNVSLNHLSTLGFSPKRLNIDELKNSSNISSRYIKISKIEDNNEYDDTFCFNEPLKHTGIFNGVLLGNCTEIIEYSSDTEYATCNLGSIALPSFIKKTANGESFFDFDELHKIAGILTRNINKIIDRTYYPVPETELSNKRHRPIGIGIQGLADTYAMMRIAFDSPEAAKLNREIFETIYHGALSASMRISKKRAEMIIEKEAYVKDIANLSIDKLDRIAAINDYLNLTQDEAKLNLIDNYSGQDYRGTYATFIGSPISEGKFQFDLWNKAPEGEWDWESLRQDIAKWGIRNSLLLAPMPTASTSQILGFNECFEPFTNNIYQRQTLAGEFTLINKYLIKDLLERGLWNVEMKNKILIASGSIQEIAEIPVEIRNLYKTVWEIKQKVLIDQSADRGIYVCQSQSLNLFVEEPELNKLSAMHFYAWKKGLKTGIYYLRTRPKAKVSAFTLDSPPSSSANAANQSVFACTRENKDCLMCSS